MTLPVGRPGAVALLLAAGIIAALIGVVFSFAPGVEAHPCTAGTHQDTNGVACSDTPGHAPDHDINITSTTITSDEPGAAVAITISAIAEDTITEDKTITVDFSGFNLPTGITNPTNPTTTNPNRATITFAGPTTIVPEEIVRQGSRVTLTIPSGPSVSIIRIISPGNGEIIRVFRPDNQDH